MTGSFTKRSGAMSNKARVGIDLAKRVFHVTAVDDAGAVVERRKLRRAGLQSYLALLPRGCTVAMEACSSANHWGRLAARHGHVVRLMGPQFVAPYRKPNKNDANDADAIVEGVVAAVDAVRGAEVGAAAARPADAPRAADGGAQPHGPGQ